jgi:transcriptional regulator with XRE-family HTH domain
MEQLASGSLPSRGSFGALLRAGRHRANLSQEQLAARAGLSERGVRNLEAGRVRSPRPDTVRLLADALQLSGPERDSWVAAASGSPRRSEPAGPVAGGTARASPGFVVGFIAVAPRGWLGPEPTGGSLGGQGERRGRDDLPAYWANVIRVLIMGKQHDID